MNAIDRDDTEESPRLTPGVMWPSSPNEESTATPPLDSDAKMVRCEEILGYQFSDRRLLRAALTHSSGANTPLQSNERLEFFGDSVLGLIVCQFLYETYPSANEGELTKIKSAVVSRRSCGKVAMRLGLDECLIVGRGVIRNRGYPKSLISDVFESIIGALYLDAGPNVAADRVLDWLAPEIELAADVQGSGNHKSSLQQVAQRELGATPFYKVVDQSGPDHRRHFAVSAVVGERRFTAAWGNNKKDAEQRAAANALAEIRGHDPPFDSDLP